jgi:hypothetical protein
LGVSDLALPRICCGCDNMDWNVIRQCIYECFDNSGINIYICTPPDPNMYNDSYYCDFPELSSTQHNYSRRRAPTRKQSRERRVQEDGLQRTRLHHDRQAQAKLAKAPARKLKEKPNPQAQKTSTPAITVLSSTNNSHVTHSESLPVNSSTIKKTNDIVDKLFNLNLKSLQTSPKNLSSESGSWTPKNNNSHKNDEVKELLNQLRDSPSLLSIKNRSPMFNEKNCDIMERHYPENHDTFHDSANFVNDSDVVPPLMSMGHEKDPVLNSNNITPKKISPSVSTQFLDAQSQINALPSTPPTLNNGFDPNVSLPPDSPFDSSIDSETSRKNLNNDESTNHFSQMNSQLSLI